jgi:hypothetical protein
MMTKYLCFIVFLLGLSACSLFQRSNSSGYVVNGESTSSTVQEYFFEKGAKAWGQAKEELGYNSGNELSEQQIQAVQLRAELNRLEKSLNNDLERKQYYSLKPFFKSDFERVYFLRLPDKESRQRWANMKGVTTDDTTFDRSVAQLIENNDIARGMSRGAVKQSWGEPDIIEAAGNPMYGNERWKYNKLVSTSDGYKPESRVIYFEAGRVIGWETL